MPETNLPELIIHSHEDEQADARQRLLDKFAERPDDDAIWQTAYSWVIAEGDSQTHPGIASDIPGRELIELAHTVRATAPSERYNLMANRASNGQRWFDALQTFSSNQVAQVREGVIGSWVNQEGSAGKFHHALDLGTGTGKSLHALEVNAQNVIGLDRNRTLLNVAREIAGENTTLVQGEVDRMPFKDASFDLVASQGLTGALDKVTLTAFYRELARVMVSNGVYIQNWYLPEDGNSGEELARITATSKGMLADMIVDTVSGALSISEHLEPENHKALLSELGLNEAHYDVVGDDGITHNLVTVIIKTSPEYSSTLSQEIASTLSNFGEEYGFDPETIEEISASTAEDAFETAYSYLLQAGLNADEILAPYLEDRSS